MNLQDYRSKGVSHFDVTNEIAVAENPCTLIKGISPEARTHNSKFHAFKLWAEANPIPCPGTVDGAYSLAQFEEVYQARVMRYSNDAEWFDINEKSYTLIEYLEKLNPGVCETRMIISLK